MIRASMAVALAAALSAGYSAQSAAQSARYKDIVMSDSKGGKETRAFKPDTPKLFIHANVAK